MANGPEPNWGLAVGIGFAADAGYLVAICLLWWDFEQRRSAVLKPWEDWCKTWLPIKIKEASTAQLAAAARAKGEPYFTASFIRLLGEKQIDGKMLNTFMEAEKAEGDDADNCLLYTSPSPRDGLLSRMPSSA